MARLRRRVINIKLYTINGFGRFVKSIDNQKGDKMTIEQAIIYIIQNTNDQQKQWASDVILGKKSITKQSKQDFYFPVFDMGEFEIPSRESLYQEACDRHLNGDWQK